MTLGIVKNKAKYCLYLYSSNTIIYPSSYEIRLVPIPANIQ